MDRSAILIPLLEEKMQKASPVILAIDGMAASGKTTLAAGLAEKYNAPVIHMDDFFLRPEQRSNERYETAGGNFDRERFLVEVAPHLGNGDSFSYQRFDCRTMSLGDMVDIPPHSLLIVEGSYSLHPDLFPLYTLRVFMKTSPAEQLSRIEKRNGKEKLIAFKERWIPLENRYFAAFSIEEKADIVLNG